MIKDSGTRRNFESGAVRDIQEGKGRCDLLPLKQVAYLLNSRVIANIYLFTLHKDINYIYDAIRYFAEDREWDIQTCTLEVAKHFEEGCIKYGERNWEKGIPCHCYLDSGVRHLIKHYRGDADEPHDRAFIWNMLCLMWTMENHPELDDVGVKNDTGRNE